MEAMIREYNGCQFVAPVIEVARDDGGQMGGLAEQVVLEQVPSLPAPLLFCETEVPVHEVCLKPFELAKYEVTQQEWARVMIYPNDPSPRDPTDYPTHYPLKENRCRLETSAGTKRSILRA